jgi:DNA repair protein RadD
VNEAREIQRSCKSVAASMGLSVDGLSRRAIEMARLDSDCPRDSLGDSGDDPPTFPFVLKPDRLDLFDYQREVVSELDRHFLRRARAMVSLPTGGGKTRTALCFVLEQFARCPSLKIRWLAPSHELVEQALEGLRQLWARAPLQAPLVVTELGSSDGVPGAIEFGTLQLAASRVSRSVKSADKPVDVVIIDEAHRASATTFARVVRQAAKAGAFVVGLSATPGRATAEECDRLSDLFEGRLVIPPVLGRNPVTALRKRGVLLEPAVIDVSGPGGAASVVGTFMRALDEHVVNCGIAFASSIADCYAIASVLELRGRRVGVVSHLQTKDRRREWLSSLSRRKVDWLVNVELLSTGVDLPMLDAIALLAPIGSPVLYEQVIGRVTRGPSVGGSSRATVFDGFCHYRRHGDISSYSRFALGSW